MKEFISSNGVNMVEGISFNWEKFEFNIININIGYFYDYVSITYNIDEKYISMSRNDKYKIYCDNIIFAEFLVLSYVKANNLEISSLYQK